MSELRAQRLSELATGYRLLAALGWGDLGDGHISARDSQAADCFWMLAAGRSFRGASASDMVMIGPDGTVREGAGDPNIPGFHIHQPILAARADVVSAVHTHTEWGTPFSAEVRMFEPITQESCIFFADHALFDDDEVQIQSLEAGARIAQSLGPNRGIILRNHGLLTVGASVAEAVAWFVTMERVAEAHLKARKARPIGAEAARYAKSDLANENQALAAFAALAEHHLD